MQVKQHNPFNPFEDQTSPEAYQDIFEPDTKKEFVMFGGPKLPQTNETADDFLKELEALKDFKTKAK